METKYLSAEQSLGWKLETGLGRYVEFASVVNEGRAMALAKGRGGQLVKNFVAFEAMIQALNLHHRKRSQRPSPWGLITTSLAAQGSEMRERGAGEGQGRTCVGLSAGAITGRGEKHTFSWATLTLY